ncbi:hypothetical protein LAG90_11670 [Marinilongibacter aquaticus]|uniref:hypothetical protein n=1 Tax=Marinilongibacter aquaticus TaxID=2975157 RepID=UPI0021BD19BF|nr:hypothetical protein [Marinilongibacter aquaticus]UBM57477.1 hypothetical protein LAG90_11670 [Marinilongibacter aquaticus]
MKWFYTLVLPFISLGSFAQKTFNVSLTMPEVALLDLASSTSSIDLELLSSLEAGDNLSLSSSNHSVWLNISSAVAPSASRRVDLQLSGTIPNGIGIYANTSSYSGSGSCSGCTAVSSALLSTGSTTVVNNIQGAYTGVGLSNGFEVEYSVSISNFSAIRSGSYSLTAIYTLTDN